MNAENYIRVFTDLRDAEKELTKNSGDSFCTYTHLVPPLPDWTNKTYKYKEHNINLYNLSCSCQKYKDLAEVYAERDVRRICEHVFAKVKSTKAKEYVDDLTYRLMEASAIYCEMERYITYLDGQEIILGRKDNSDWINIYTTIPTYFDLKKKLEIKYYTYSYSIAEKRWAYNSHPCCDVQMIKIIESFIKFDINKELK